MEEIAPARQTQGPIAGTGRNVIGQSSKERVLWTVGRPRMPIRQPLQRTEVWAGLGRRPDSRQNLFVPRNLMGIQKKLVLIRCVWISQTD